MSGRLENLIKLVALSYQTCLIWFALVNLTNHGKIAAAAPASFKSSGHSQPNYDAQVPSSPSPLPSFPATGYLQNENNFKYLGQGSKSTMAALKNLADWGNSKKLMESVATSEVSANHRVITTSNAQRRAHESSSTTESEMKNTLDHLLEVMGPHLFLIPFLLQTLPFAIPSLPLSYLLSVYEPHEVMENVREMLNRMNEMMTGETSQTGLNATGAPPLPI